MTEIPIQISQLPVQQPDLPISSSTASGSPTTNSTGNTGFKLSLLTPRKPSYNCCLVFRNFYVAWLRIVQVNIDGSSTELAATYPLMQHVHCEDDAEDWQLIKLDQLPVSWNPHVFDSLCIYISQPSPLWRTCDLRDIKLYMTPQDLEAGTDQAKDSDSLALVSPTRLKSRREQNDSGSEQQFLDRRMSQLTLEQSHAGADVKANAVNQQAARCLDLVLRLRAIFQK